MLITFSGLDGAGKSTLVAWLKQELEREHRRVVVFHLPDHVGIYAALRALRDRLLGRPPEDNGGAPTGVPARGPVRRTLHRIRNAVLWNRPVRRLLYPIDLLLFWALYRVPLEKLGGRVLIMDRYFYDGLVDVADGRHWAWLRLLKRLTPTPDVPVFLDTGPEEAFARKREHTVEYLRRRYLGYRTVFPWVASSVVLASQDLAAAQAALSRIVRERMGGR
jgi:thymidylate kinase